jgi:beta-galactosidase
MNSNLELGGSWDIAYSTFPLSCDQLPAAAEYRSRLPVPAYWEDHPEAFSPWDCLRNPQYQEIDFTQCDKTSPDSSLPFVCGTVYYRRKIEYHGGRAVLTVGGVFLECACFLNGRFCGHHLSHSTPAEFILPEESLQQETNELVLAVSNLREDRLGCIIRGFKGRSGGISRPVRLQCWTGGRIADAYLRLLPGTNREIAWQLTWQGPASASIRWQLQPQDSRRETFSGTAVLQPGENHFVTSAPGLQLWSDQDPQLYALRISGSDGPELLHQTVGFRLLTASGCTLALNGEPIFLRGATEHAYYPETCNAPQELSAYRSFISKLRAIGFNFLRFHTSVPNEEYMQAADELGMIIQVEPPVGFGQQEWLDILRTCRKHPSVAIYCAGNEELLDEKHLTYLRYIAGLQKQLVPDALFNPQEALRGIEYAWQASDYGTPLQHEPFLHNPARLATLKEYSDVLGQYAWGFLSYLSSEGDWRELDRRLAIYQRPCLEHELCISGTYLDFQQRERYRGTRIGDRLFAPVEQVLQQAGLFERRDLYYRNSCLWAKLLRKFCLENARHSRLIAGYDLLGAIDIHWHRHCYPCGIMNEFYELKPGETAAEVLQYNGPAVLLLNLGTKRNFLQGEELTLSFTLSNFAAELTAGSWHWQIQHPDGAIAADCHTSLPRPCPAGELTLLQDSTIRLPASGHPEKLQISAWLEDTHGQVFCRNDWSVWSFPAVDDDCLPEIYPAVEPALLARINAGEWLLCAGQGLPLIETQFQISCAGRMEGNLATVVNSHPMLGDFPHEGFCDWQFHQLFSQATTVNLTSFPEQLFAPVLEVASSYKRPLRQGSLFEWALGAGRLLVCSLNLTANDPAARYLRYQLGQYLQTAGKGKCLPCPRLVSADLLNLNTGGITLFENTDAGFDARAQLRK